jgi:hypothetical protein
VKHAPPSTKPDSPGPAPGWVGLSTYPRLLWGLAVCIVVMNLADAVFTLDWVWTGRATEANPLLAGVVVAHPILFVALKSTLVSLGLWLLWRLRSSPWAVVAIFVAFIVYYWVMTVHLGAIRLWPGAFVAR